ncbi:MAG TPA: PepSY-associated TM helix domain-containing protein [Rudaea sp.]
MNAATPNVETNASAATRVRRASGTHRLIRQLHLWIGAWGAIAAILFGSTGFLQNHRAILKLPQGDSTELSKVDLEVPEEARASPDALRAWLSSEKHLDADNARVQPGGPVDFNGQRVKQPARWMFGGGNARVSWNAEYTAGNATVSVRTTQQSPLAVLSRLHKGVGGGVAWILLTDSFAIAMMLLGITGLVLWARGRGVRQMVFSIVGAAVVVLALIGGAAVL